MRPVLSMQSGWRALALAGSRQANAPPPVFFTGAGSAVFWKLDPPASKKAEGARDAWGPDGPTGLDASQHRGLSKSWSCRKSARSKGVPRAVFIGLLRALPGGRSFQCAYAC